MSIWKNKSPRKVSIDNVPPEISGTGTISRGTLPKLTKPPEPGMGATLTGNAASWTKSFKMTNPGQVCHGHRETERGNKDKKQAAGNRSRLSL